MFFLVTVVPKCNDAKVTESGRQIRNGNRPYAQCVFSKSRAFMSCVAFNDVLQALFDFVHPHVRTMPPGAGFGQTILVARSLLASTLPACRHVKPN
jgi:hypothetical protein